MGEGPSVEESFMWPVCELIRRAVESGASQCVVRIESDAEEAGSVSSGWLSAEEENSRSVFGNYVMNSERRLRRNAGMSGTIVRNQKAGSPTRQRRIIIEDNGSRGGLDQRIHPAGLEVSVQGSRVLDSRFHVLGRILAEGSAGYGFIVGTAARGARIKSQFRYANRGMHEYERERRNDPLHGHTVASFYALLTDLDFNVLERRLEQFMARTILALSTVRTTRRLRLDLIVTPHEEAVIPNASSQENIYQTAPTKPNKKKKTRGSRKRKKKQEKRSRRPHKKQEEDDSLASLESFQKEDESVRSSAESIESSSAAASSASSEDEEDQEDEEEEEEADQGTTFISEANSSIVNALQAYVMHFVSRRVANVDDIVPLIASAESRRDATRVTVARLPYGSIFRRNKIPNPNLGLMEVVRLVDGTPLVDGYGGKRCALTTALYNADWSRWNCALKFIGDTPFLRFGIERIQLDEKDEYDDDSIEKEPDLGLGDIVVVVEVDCVDAISGIDDLDTNDPLPGVNDSTFFDRDYELGRSAREFCPLASDAVTPLLQLAIDRLGPKVFRRAKNAREIQIAKHHLPKILVAIDSIATERIQNHPALSLLRRPPPPPPPSSSAHSSTLPRLSTSDAVNRRRSRDQKEEEEEENASRQHNRRHINTNERYQVDAQRVQPPAKRLARTEASTFTQESADGSTNQFAHTGIHVSSSSALTANGTGENLAPRALPQSSRRSDTTTDPTPLY